MDIIREEFEKWAEDNYDFRMLGRDERCPDVYKNHEVSTAWYAWEYCWKLKDKLLKLK